MMEQHMGFDPLRALRFAAVGALVLFLCWQHVHATRLGYQVESSRRKARELRGRVETLRLEIDSGLSPAALAARAGSRLGMIPVSPDSLRALPERSERGLAFRVLWAKAFSPLQTRS